MAKSAAKKTVRYSRYELKQAVWHLRDVENLPQGFQRKPMRTAGDAADMLGFLFKDLAQEMVVVAMLSERNCLQIVDVATMGTLNACLAHPREIFRSAIACLAAKIIVMHNHPSGNTTPSEEDIELTHQVETCGRILGIPLIDHLIFAGDECVSLRELGYIN